MYCWNSVLAFIQQNICYFTDWSDVRYPSIHPKQSSFHVGHFDKEMILFNKRVVENNEHLSDSLNRPDFFSSCDDHFWTLICTFRIFVSYWKKKWAVHFHGCHSVQSPISWVGSIWRTLKGPRPSTQASSIRSLCCGRLLTTKREQPFLVHSIQRETDNNGLSADPFLPLKVRAVQLPPKASTFSNSCRDSKWEIFDDEMLPMSSLA